MSTEPDKAPAGPELADAARYASVWRREPPDRPGWWWRMSANLSLESVVRAVMFQDGIRIQVGLVPQPMSEHWGGWWAGPLEPPPPPDDSHNSSINPL